MLTRFSILLCILCAIVLVGCSKSETNTNTASTANANKATTAPAAPATASADKIGVPECDEYLNNYDACITGKVPEIARAQYKSAIEQTRSSWRKLAENPQTKSTLAAACKAAADQARTAMKSYNCTF